eukprot:CAMPEP_0172478918 /NCGR_PEP_ID=MMETSP1066-20121228/3150_1 /TAXON_ID=671091 /ORGANISM="Coscinodiscus wailesii, Strain CCMP2513" /LENGTH=172 /DNA_ID=CAMNT_0013238873 /DNA_START=15 /DNA_END=533 /DNA_ORIENTATION=-
MTFKLSDRDPDIQQPTSQTIETKWDGNLRSYGAMFDVFARTDLIIDALEINVATTERVLVEVWTREGSARHTHNNRSGWNRLVATYCTGRGKGNKTPIRFKKSAKVNERKTQAFYVRIVNKQSLIYSTGSRFGKKVARNDDIVIREGYGKTSRFGSASYIRIFNGLVHYKTV